MKIECKGRELNLGPHPSKLAVKRWTGVYSPEPETWDWIEGLASGELFYDIGASVGTHSVHAALCGLTVTAFEPVDDCYAELVRVTRLNKLAITCYKMAVSNVNAKGHMVRGRSTATFEQRITGPVTSVTLDTFTRNMNESPAYIKIDVDGNEPEIIAGGINTIRRAKSVLIEVDPGALRGNSEIPYVMRELGFTWDRQQVDACMVREGKYKGLANYIFYR